jgi:hypothetical protein
MDLTTFVICNHTGTFTLAIITAEEISIHSRSAVNIEGREEKSSEEYENALSHIKESYTTTM